MDNSYTIFTYDKDLNEYLNKEKAKSLFKNKFSIKVLKSDIRFNDRIKILLFRISPRAYIKIINSYKKIINKK